MLLPNYNVFNANPGRAIGGPTDPTIWYKGGTVQNFYSGDHVVSGQTDKSSFPPGYNPPHSWILAPKAGGMSSHNEATFTITPAAAIAGGLPASGSTTITLTPTATGGLIVSGFGSASITLSATGSILSIAAASGSATVSLSGTALIGALAGLSGSSTVTLTPTAAITAIGYLSGISTSESEFSEAALARAVWDAVASDYNDSGSMGAKMNAAGGSNSPEDIADAVWTAANMDTAAINKIADILLRRANSSVEASSNGEALSVRSLYGMIAQATNKTSVSGSTLTVTKSDDTTALGTRTIETDSNQAPITSFDTD